MQLNPDIPFSIIANWFFNESDLSDGEEEIDLNQVTYDQLLQQSPLPSLNAFESNFPKIGSDRNNYREMRAFDVYSLAGGSLFTNHFDGISGYKNACSIRGSRALLYSGVEIPIIRNNANQSQRTEKE